MNRDNDTIPAETMDSLTRYSWPGNIRELQNLVERAVILSPCSVLHVPLEDLKHRCTSAITLSSQTLEETERAHILGAGKNQMETLWPEWSGCTPRFPSHHTPIPNEKARHRTSDVAVFLNVSIDSNQK